MAFAEQLSHPLPPVFNPDSRVLILGSFPSPQSREIGFYYAHPRNRFWPALAAVWEESIPLTTEERRAFALRHRIALWDVLASCTITGASDSSIRNPVPNDLTALLAAAPIRAIFTTGQTAARLYARCCEPQTGIPAGLLPSPSPANCRLPMEALVAAYRVLRTHTELT